MKQFLLMGLALAFCMGAFAQKSKVTSAGIYIGSGDYDKAKQYIDEAFGDPKVDTWDKAWYYKAVIYSRMFADAEKYGIENPEEYLEVAKDAFDNVLKYADDRSSYAEDMFTKPPAYEYIYIAYRNKGTESLNKNDYENAYQYFGKAVAANDLIRKHVDMGIDTAAIFLLGYSAEISERPEEAADLYNKLVEMGYFNELLYSRYINLLLISDDEDVLEVIEAGRKLFPNSNDLMVAELNYYLKNDQAKKAVDKFEKAAAEQPDNAELQFALAAAIYDKFYEDAKTAYEADPSEANKAEVLKWRTKLLQGYDNTLKADPEHAKANYNKGVVYYNEAVEIAKEMNDIPPADRKRYNAKVAEYDAKLAESLPFLERAHELYLKQEADPAKNLSADDINSWRAVMMVLKGIYVRKNDQAKADAIKAKLETLGG